MSGLKFPEKLEIDTDDLKCVICHNITANLVSPTECHHLHCVACLNKMTQAQRDQCSVCRQPADNWYKELWVEHLVKNTRVTCEYCDRSDTYKNMAGHVWQCGSRPAKCQYCQEANTYEKNAEHEVTCVFGRAACKYCRSTLQRGAIAGHEQYCNYRPVYCENCKVEAPLWVHEMCERAAKKTKLCNVKEPGAHSHPSSG